MPARPLLGALAGAKGIETTYVDVSGRTVPTSDRTREAILHAMGVDASSEALAGQALDRLRRTRAETPIDPAYVISSPGRSKARLGVRVPAGRRVDWSATLVTEDGERRELSGRTVVRDGQARVTFGELPAPGYHRLEVRLAAGDWRGGGTTALIVVPPSCFPVTAALGSARGFGVWANLYAVRTERDWGIGDVGSLHALVEWAGGAGADFVGVNPLHALFDRGTEISPYSPVSRLYRNPVYVDVAAVPEFGAAPGQIPPELASALSDPRAARQVDYPSVLLHKLGILRLLHAEFVRRERTAPTERGRAFARYVAEQGTPLRDYATFMALDETVTAAAGPTWWRRWPAGFRSPDAPGMDAVRSEHAEAIEFHCFVQFELDRQLAAVADAARAAGMRIGLYQDLAVGSSSGGSDAWSHGELFRLGATIGAPPDPFSASGQNWGLPPIDPAELAARGFDYWIRLVRNAMRHAGALRIDHAMGVGRLFWIPEGSTASDGAYVRYPERELLGILALESHRARAVVVGEDLGTVPAGFGRTLARYQILSSRVLYFERTRRGAFRASSAYSPRALVTTTTHDHPPLRSFWEGEDIEIGIAIGRIAATDGTAARKYRARERANLVRRLREEGLLAEADPEYETLLVAVHQFLSRTPSPLFGAGLEDLAAETAPVNIPGIGPERYPTWSRRLGRTLESLVADPTVNAALAAARRA